MGSSRAWSARASASVVSGTEPSEDLSAWSGPAPVLPLDAPSDQPARSRRPPLTSQPAAAPASALDQEGLAEVRRIGTADLMVGIPSFGNAEKGEETIRRATERVLEYIRSDYFQPR